METEFAYVFRIMITKTAIISVHTIHRLVFLMEAHFVLYKEQTESLYACSVG
jgi:hypothetical protein